jgi:hypothetical protein
MKKDFHRCETVCSQLGSKLAVLKDTLCNTANLLQPCNYDSREFLFAGYTDFNEEGTYEDVQGNRLNLNDTELSWLTTNPNGFENENCLAIMGQNTSKILDISCSIEAFPICNITKEPIFSLEGGSQLPGINHDEKFLITRNMTNGQFFLFGFNGSSILMENSTWILRNNGQIKAISKDSNNIPLGQQKWFSKVDDTYATEMNINACNKDEYPCADGACVNKWNRCDQTAQCSDGSDEDQCNLFSLSSGYNSLLAPICSRAVFNITFMVNITQIVKIDLQDQSFEAKLSVEAMWQDNRATFYNLLENSQQTSLTHKEIALLWKPYVMFLNQRSAFGSSLEIQFFTASSSDNQHLPSESSKLYRDFPYDAKNVALTMIKDYSNEFLCNLQLGKYPFDQQTCKLQMFFPHTHGRINISTIQSLRTTEYSVYSIKLGQEEIITERKGTRIEIPIIMISNVRPIMMNTFLPTTLLVIITQLTNYFELPEMYEIATTVNTTVLLTLSALFVAVFNRYSIHD